MRPAGYGIHIASLAALAWTLAECIRPGPNISGATTSTEQRSASADGPELADGKRLVIWDGAHIKARNVGTGRMGRIDFWDGGKGWADCDSKPKCEAALAAKSGVGVDGRKGLEFRAEGVGWAGSGWSWFGWYPPTAGTDLSPYKNLTFQIRVEAKSAGDAPDPRTVAVLLACSNGRKTTARAMVQKYDGRFDDGNWHKIAIPIADLREGDGVDFDSTTAWEFRLSTWNATSRDFSIYIDQIAAEK